MAEVVYNSLQYLADDDARAMAIYLKSIADPTPKPPAPAVLPGSESSLLISLGKTVYVTHCAACHGAQGEGQPPHWPPLAHNQPIDMTSAVNPIRMMLNGGYPPGTKGKPRPYGMPPFAGVLSDDEIAAVVSYIRTSWGNRGAPVRLPAAPAGLSSRAAAPADAHCDLWRAEPRHRPLRGVPRQPGQ